MELTIMGIEFEPLSNRWKQDPYPIYRQLRDEAPVHYAPESDQYVITRYDDVARVLKSPDVFSSTIDPRQMPGGSQGRLAQLRRAMTTMVQMRVLPWTAASARFLIAEGGESHSAMRSVVNRGFTPRQIAAWEDRAHALAAEGVARLRSGEPFDLVRDLAVPLPVTMIAEILGVESERMHDFKRWSDAFITGGTGSTQGKEGDRVLFRAMTELRTYLRPIVKARRAKPADDLISVLVASGGEADLNDFEIFLFIFLLLLAGNETTTNLLGNTVDALLGHPDELARVQDDLSLVPALVEEVLRWDSPVQMLQRTTTEEVELHGIRIPKGAQVAAMLGAANRDERRFDNADRFDVKRDAKPHLSFGLGAHFCLGSSLARLEAKAALEALVPELRGVERVVQEREFVDSFVVRGLKRLELRAV
jgi:cytochrome P450